MYNAQIEQGTKPVQYLELKPEQPSLALTPGRGLSSTCLNNPYRTSYSYLDSYLEACILEPGDAVNPPTLSNQTEFFKTAANYSDINQVYLSDGYAVLGPVSPDPGLDFQALSFGSKSACRAVTGLCGAISTAGARYAWPSLFNFMCNASVAGLNMTGNFANVLNISTSLQASNENSPNISSALQVAGANTMYPSNQIQFQYFTDAQKQNQTAVPDFYVGIGGDISQLYWATVWTVPFTSPLNQGENQSSTDDVASVGMTDVYTEGLGSGGGSVGILSCETNISEIVGFLSL